MNIKHYFQFCSRIAVCGLSLATLFPVTLQAQTVSWTKQLGTSSYDRSSGVATDSKGNVYISGYTYGSLGGVNQGGFDAWVAKYNSTGVLLWKKQLGTSNDDESNSVATDTIGNIYISGSTEGSLGGANQGLDDAWVAKYNSTGALVWKKQLGTSGHNASRGVATDSKGNVYISGYSGYIQGYIGGDYPGLDDAWVAKYNSAGVLLWQKQLGTFNNDESNSVATDTIGNVYISGSTEGSLGGAYQGEEDAWVAKYNSTGALVWKRQLGTSSEDGSFSVATDLLGNVYVSGNTKGSLGGAYQGGVYDAWAAKYNCAGTLVWKKQLGTFDFDISYGVATDSNNNVYISGLTGGSLGGANQGGVDAWIAKYSSAGVLVWQKQLGISSYEYSSSVATDSKGNVYISGETNGLLGGANQGLSDAWVAKILN